MIACESASGSMIIVIGPSPEALGGMASVMQQMLALDFGGKYRLEAFPVTVSPDGSESPVGRIIRHVGHLRRLGEVIRGCDSPIVHIHTCSGFSFFRSVMDMLVAQARGCRAILHVHGAEFDEFHRRAGILGKRLIAWSLARADRVVALSQAWRAKLLNMAPEARVVVIENAVAMPKVVPARPGGEQCRFALLARMDEWKGIDDLLAACAELKADRCTLEVELAGPPGTAGDARVLARKIRALGLDGMVRYIGPVHGNDKAGLLRRADAYVQPSHHEGMPISLLEALGFGLPVAATEVGAVPEVITDGREGLLVPPHRPERLAAAMRALATDPGCRARMSRAARERVSTRFGLDRFRDNLLSLYNELSPGPAEPVHTTGASPARPESGEKKSSLAVAACH